MKKCFPKQDSNSPPLAFQTDALTNELRGSPGAVITCNMQSKSSLLAFTGVVILTYNITVIECDSLSLFILLLIDMVAPLHKKYAILSCFNNYWRNNVYCMLCICKCKGLTLVACRHTRVRQDHVYVLACRVLALFLFNSWRDGWHRFCILVVVFRGRTGTFRLCLMVWTPPEVRHSLFTSITI